MFSGTPINSSHVCTSFCVKKLCTYLEFKMGGSKGIAIIILLNVIFFTFVSSSCVIPKPPATPPPAPKAPVTPPPAPKAPAPVTPPPAPKAPVTPPPAPKAPAPVTPPPAPKAPVTPPPTPKAPVTPPPAPKAPAPVTPPPAPKAPVTPPPAPKAPVTPPPAPKESAKCPPPPAPEAPVTPPPTPKKPAKCPIDTLKFGVCGDLLGLVHQIIGAPPSSECCALINGLADLEAAVCLCTAIKANVLGMINMTIPVALSMVINSCGKKVPEDFQCA